MIARIRLLLILVLALIVQCSTSLLAQWADVDIPLAGSNVTNIVRTSVAGDTILYGSQNGILSYSLDKGATWTVMGFHENGGSDYDIVEVSCLISMDTYVIVGHGSVVSRVSKNGTQWTDEYHERSPGPTLSLAANSSYLFAGTPPYGVDRSADNGNSWLPSGLWGKTVQTLAVNGTRIFAGTETSGVFVSTDDGANWTPSSTGITDSTINVIIVSPAIIGSKNVNIFAATGQGVYISKNNGATWGAANTGLPLTQGKYYQVSGFAVMGTQVFAATKGGGVFVTRNEGASWTDVSSDLIDLAVDDISVIGTDLYVSTKFSGLALSTNQGTSWKLLSAPADAFTALGINTNTDGSGVVIYAGVDGRTGGGVFRSTNSGASWKVSGINPADDQAPMPSVLAFGPSATGSTGTNVYAGTTSGLFRSTNGGASWDALTTGLPWELGQMGAVQAAIGSLATNGSSVFAELSNRVFVSTDYGTNWNSTNTGLPQSASLSSILIVPSSAGAAGVNIFVATRKSAEPGRGVFLSTNYGASWNEVNTGLLELEVSCLAAIGTDIFAGTDHGVYRTTNNGTNWSAVNNGILNRFLPGTTQSDDITALTSSGTYLFAGAVDGGIFLSANSGESWTIVRTKSTEKNPSSIIQMGIAGDEVWALLGQKLRRLIRRPLSEMIIQIGSLTIDASGFPQIRALVTVSVSSELPIAGLTSGNFSVREDGIIESPLVVVPTEGSRSPVMVMIAVDKGEAMTSDALARAKTSASNFVQLFRSSDSAAVLPFNNQVVMGTPFTSNQNILIESIHGIGIAGSKVSAIYDALYESIRQLKNHTGSKAILLISAGIDQSGQHGQSEILELLARSNIPVYVIGFPAGALGEEMLARIAKTSGGGYYVEPGTEGLAGIYQAISSALKNQYRITYTSHNTAADGSSRMVAITTTYNNSSGTQQKPYLAPLSTTASSVVPTSAAVVPVGQPFWVEVKVGDPNSVKDLYGISFKLRSSVTTCTYVTGSATAGSFLGTGPLTFFQSPDAQTVSATVTKTAVPGVNGSGIVARFQFTTPSTLTSVTNITFTITDVQANNSTGASIPMSLGSLTISASPSASVWPGDCDNSGNVTAADVLPIGLYYGQKNATTPVTNNPGIQWQVYKRTFWLSDSLGKKVYADADGNGVIDGADVLAVGLNYSKAPIVIGKVGASIVSNNAVGILEISSVTRASNSRRHVQIPIVLNTTKSVYGVSFTLTTGTSERFVSIDTSVNPFGKALMLSKASDALGVVDIGITSMSGAGFTGTGKLMTIEVELPNVGVSSVSYDITNIIANDAGGNTVNITGTSYRGAVSETGQGLSIPTEYGLSQNYPNPFNPATSFEFQVPSLGFVRLSLFDMLGREVARLVEGERAPGRYLTRWDASTMPSGVYYYRMTATEKSGNMFAQTRRMALVK